MCIHSTSWWHRINMAYTQTFVHVCIVLMYQYGMAWHIPCSSCVINVDFLSAGVLCFGFSPNLRKEQVEEIVFVRLCCSAWALHGLKGIWHGAMQKGMSWSESSCNGAECSWRWWNIQRRSSWGCVPVAFWNHSPLWAKFGNASFCSPQTHHLNTSTTASLSNQMHDYILYDCSATLRFLPRRQTA